MKILASIICLFIFYIASAGDNSFAIIENKIAKGYIVIPKNSIPVEKKAAFELQEYLAKSTGITLSIVPENNIKTPVNGFYLGRTQAALKAGLDMNKQPLDAFQIRYLDGKLFIIGHDSTGSELSLNTAAGTLFGVYRYLMHNVKVRWLWPGTLGEFVPKNKIIRLDDKANYMLLKPLQRRLCHAIWRPSLPESRWAKRVFFQGDKQITPVMWGGGHILDKYVPIYSKTHPQWYAMRPDGKRKNFAPTSFCLSNKEFQQELLNLWKKELEQLKKKNPKAHLILNFHRGDVELNCVCSKCQKLDGKDFRLPTRRYSPFKNVGERYAKVALELNKKVQEIDPGSGVSILAYQSGVYAPREVKLNSNIQVKVCVDIPFPRRAGHTKRIWDEYLAWYKSGAQLILRPNFFSTGYCMPEIWYDDFAAELNHLRDKCGIISFDVDGPFRMWSINGVNIYVALRMAAEPGLTVNEAFNEYCEGFGPAAKEVGIYLNYWRNYVKRNAEKLNTIHEKYCTLGWDFYGFEYPKYVHHSYPPYELRKSLTLLDAAAKAAKNDANSLAKVEFLRKGLEHAIMVSETAAIFANPLSSSTARKAAKEKLYKFRKSLPEYAIYMPNLQKYEDRIWKVASGIPKDSILLPEYWKGYPDPENNGEKLGFFKEEFDCSKWKNVSTWNALRSQNYQNFKYMWYRLKITLPPEDSAERAYLCLGAVDEDCKIWINGKIAGGFLSNFTVDPDSWKRPYKIEITDWIRYGRPNYICVRVRKQNPGLGGIWKASWIELKNRLSQVKNNNMKE